MESGQLQKYQQICKLFKEIIDSITTLEVPQLKLYFVNLEKRILAKETSLLEEYDSLAHLLNTTKQAKGKMPLHFAIARGNLQIVIYMIQTLKLDAYVKDKEGNSPFFTAVEHGHLHIVQYYIQQLKTSANESKEGEIIALHLAANGNHVDLINYLISKNANIEKVSIYGKPINWAVGMKHFEATKVLLDHGADPNGDFTGSSLAPLILAIDYKDEQLYNILIEKGANVNVKDPNGYSALHVAAEKGQLKFVKDLVSRGASTDLQVDGKNPLYLAFENSRMEVVNFLKEKEPNFLKIQQKIKEEQLKNQKKEVNKERAEEIKIIGNKFYADKKYEEALVEYIKALEHDEQNQIIHRNVAACYLALEKYELALVHCCHAKKNEKNNVKTTYREAQAHIGLGNLVQASTSMWQCCLLEPANNFFRTEFQRLYEEAKSKHKQQNN